MGLNMLNMACIIRPILSTSQLFFGFLCCSMDAFLPVVRKRSRLKCSSNGSVLALFLTLDCNSSKELGL